MPILYNKVRRVDPRDATAEKSWYPVIKSTGLVREKEVAKLLSDETTLNRKEAEMTISQLLKVVTNLLLNGNTVQLGELGSFRITAKGEASEKMEEVTAAKIKKVNARFTSSADFKSAMAKAKFMDVATLVHTPK